MIGMRGDNMSINARIKEARKTRGYTQGDLAELMGVAQTSISFMEKEGNTVPDKNIKTICLLLKLNENWLRTGALPMFLESEIFSLDSFVNERGGSELEIEMVKTYFELDVDVRKAIIEHFKNRLISTEKTNIYHE